MVHLVLGRGVVAVKGEHRRDNDIPRLTGGEQIAAVDAVEGHLPGHHHHPAVFFQAHVRRPHNEVLVIGVGQSREGLHAAREDDHPVGAVGAAGNGGRQIVHVIGIVRQFLQLFQVYGGLPLEDHLYTSADHQVGLHLVHVVEYLQQSGPHLHSRGAANCYNKPFHVCVSSFHGSWVSMPCCAKNS